MAIQLFDEYSRHYLYSKVRSTGQTIAPTAYPSEALSVHHEPVRMDFFQFQRATKLANPPTSGTPSIVVSLFNLAKP